MNHSIHRLLAARLRDRILASDPTLERLRSSLRALLTTGLAAALFLLVTRLLDLPYKLALPGIVVPMIAAVAIQDTGRKAQQTTMAWVPVVACLVLALGSVVADKFWLSGACFLLTIFAAFQARRLGPRGAGLGTIAYQSFFYAMLLKTPPAQAGWTPLFVFAGCAIAWIVQFVLVAERPDRVLHAQLRAWRARRRALLDDLAAWLEAGHPRTSRRIDAGLGAMREQSLGLDGRLAGFAEDGQAASALRDEVLRCDLALETVAGVARGLDAGAADGRRALAAQLRTLQAGGGLPPDAGADLPSGPRWRLERALRTLAGLAPGEAPVPAMAAERRPAPPASSAKDGAKDGANASPTDARNGRKWFDDTTRRAVQATAAALGAMLAGRALSPDHWYWAVFAAFVVFTRSVTVGQTLSGAWRQVLSAVAGLGLGMLVAELAHGNETLELTLLFVFVALGFYAFKGWQNVYVVLLSAMLAMLYELMGMDSTGLLLIRLGETAAGAVCAALSAGFVLPVRTRDESDAKSADLLRAAGRALEQASRQPPPQPPLHEALRDLDRKHQALRGALGPITGTGYPAPNARHEERLRLLSAIACEARHAVALVTEGAVDGGALCAAAEMLADQLDATAATLDAPDPDHRPGAGQSGLPRLPVPQEATGASAVPLNVAARWLTDMQDTLRRLRAAPEGAP
jgi:uncharacterized membrane protein YgaE (UPF0421/DUF939 family)